MIMDKDVEPALEAIDFATNDSASHRLNLLCLKVECEEGTDNEVESKKRKIRKTANKKKQPTSPSSTSVSSSPRPPSESLDGDGLTPYEEAVEATDNIPTNGSSSPPSTDQSDPFVEETTKEDIETEAPSPQKFFCDIFWQQQADSPDKCESLATNRQSNDTNGGGIESRVTDFDFAKSICLGNNARARVMIDILPDDDDEEIIETFMCFKGSLLGVHHRPPLVFVLITNKALYLMNHVHESQLFTLEAKVPFSLLKQIVIDTFQPGLVFVAEATRIEVCCGSHDLMDSIIQCINLSCRENGFSSPLIVSDSSSVNKVEKSLAKYLNVDEKDVKVRHSVSVFCSRSVDETIDFDNLLESTELIENFDQGSFGLKEGMLMYQLVYDHPTSSHWSPGYFALADGYLYCYSDVSKNHLKFFGQLFNNHCKGCRRVTEDTSRPHVIELQLVVDNVVRFLYLAASNEAETTEWMMNLLTSVNIDSPENIGHFDGKNCLEKFCLLVLTEDALFTLVRDVSSTSYHVLDHVNVCDVMATIKGADDGKTSFTFLVVEFESSQTSNSREWTIYFATKRECNVFFKSLSQTWEELFQVPLQCLVLDQVTRVDEGCEANVAQQTLRRLSYWHRNAVSVLME